MIPNNDIGEHPTRGLSEEQIKQNTLVDKFVAEYRKSTKRLFGDIRHQCSVVARAKIALVKNVTEGFGPAYAEFLARVNLSQSSASKYITVHESYLLTAATEDQVQHIPPTLRAMYEIASRIESHHYEKTDDLAAIAEQRKKATDDFVIAIDRLAMEQGINGEYHTTQMVKAIVNEVLGVEPKPKPNPKPKPPEQEAEPAKPAYPDPVTGVEVTHEIGHPLGEESEEPSPSQIEAAMLDDDNAVVTQEMVDAEDASRVLVELQVKQALTAMKQYRIRRKIQAAVETILDEEHATGHYKIMVVAAG